MKLVEHFESGLDAPDLPDVGADLRLQPRCAHCPSSSGRRVRAS